MLEFPETAGRPRMNRALGVLPLSRLVSRVALCAGQRPRNYARLIGGMLFLPPGPEFPFPPNRTLARQ